jgi:hypothetical protein
LGKAVAAILEREGIWLSSHRAPGFLWSMIFSENRYTLFRIMLEGRQNRTGADMKVNVEIDCTPLEARQFFGLPDVAPMQTAVMDQLQHQMMANIEKITPEALMQSWFTIDPKIAERFQDMFVTMMGGSRSVDKKK